MSTSLTHQAQLGLQQAQGMTTSSMTSSASLTAANFAKAVQQMKANLQQPPTTTIAQDHINIDIFWIGLTPRTKFRVLGNGRRYKVQMRIWKWLWWAWHDVRYEGYSRDFTWESAIEAASAVRKAKDRIAENEKLKC